MPAAAPDAPAKTSENKTGTLPENKTGTAPATADGGGHPRRPYNKDTATKTATKVTTKPATKARKTKGVDPTTVDPTRRTDADVWTLPPGDHHFGNGLYLRVEHRGSSRKFFTKPTCLVAGVKKRRPFTIGDPANIDVEAARLESIRIHRLADGGHDVKRELTQQQEANVPTPRFGEYATTFMERHLPGLKNENHREKWKGSLTNHVKPTPLWNLPVDAVMVRDVLAVLDPIWKTIPVMANEVRSRIEMILNDAANRLPQAARYHDFNPAKWTTAMQHSLGKRPQSGATRGAMGSVPYRHVPALMTELRARGAQTARAIYAITLSCLRWQEFVQMRLAELDLDNPEQPTWTIPFARFKYDTMHKQDYVVPLAPQLVDILREQIAELQAIHGPGHIDYIWPASMQGSRDGETKNPHISSSTMLNYLQHSMKRPKATIHGSRASFETWSDDQYLEGTKTPKYHEQAIEFCVAHVAPGGKTKRSYRRGMMFDARISIMNDWANFCVPQTAESSNVTPIRPEVA